MMINFLVNLLYLASCWVVLFVILSWLIGGVYPLFSRTLKQINPDNAAFFTFIFGLLVPLAALITLIILSFPNIAFSIVADHCHGADCSPHRPHTVLGTVFSVTKVALLVVLLFGVFVVIVRQLFSSRSKLEVLDQLAESTSFSYKILDNDAMLAWCTGLIKPRIFVSRGLINGLTPREFNIVLAHEYSHLKRKDNLRKWLLYWATIAWPKICRKKIRYDHSDFSEQICDVMAVQSLHASPEEVVNTFRKCIFSGPDETRSERQQDFHLRTRKLEKNLQLRQPNAMVRGGTGWNPILFVSVLWVFLIILSVYIGHPVFEWLVA